MRLLPSPPPADRLAGSLHFDAWLVAAFGAFVALFLGRRLVFGSETGHCVYPILGAPTAAALLVGLAGAVGLAFAFLAGLRQVDRHPWAVVSGWLAAVFLFQVAIRALYPIPLGHIVESDACNSFYSAALRWPAGELLRQWKSIAPQLPQHAATNMPGKILIYSFLELFSRNPRTLGLLVLALSDLGCALVFLVAKEWFGSARTGLLALALALLLPAKMGFFPVLNTVTPGFLLLSFWLWLVSLRRLQLPWLLLLGASLYLLLLIEPLPFVAGVIFLGAFAQRLAISAMSAISATAAIDGRALWRIAVFPLAGFLLAYAALQLAFGFEILPVFRAMLADAVDFNRRFDRSYGIWVIQNLKEFFLGAGVVPSLLYLAALFALGRRIAGEAREVGGRGALRALLVDPAANLLLSFTLCLLTVDLLGVNRGEVTRLWIFLGVFLELAVAAECLARPGERTAYLAISTVAFQAALTASTVGFLIC